MANNFLVLVIFCSSSLFLSLDVNGNEINNSDVNKTSTDMSKKSKREIAVDSENSHESNEIPSSKSFVKRAPSGFTGMRGKKQSEYTDLIPNALDWSIDNEYSLNDNNRYKKAPSGFHGVRGKKMDQFEYEKSLLDQLFRRLYQENNDFENVGVYRSNTPYSQSFEENDEWAENDLEKRAPSGFTGMRGKRPISFPFDGGKRTPNAFFGVRGKRDFKRSAAEQFQPEFLGFRNKFVGVRGKKDSNAMNLHRLESQMLGLPAVDNNNYRSLTRFLIEPPEFVSLKRAPSGFLGMRGKRDTSRDDQLF